MAGHVLYTYPYIHVYIYRSVGLPSEGQSEVITLSLLLTSGEKKNILIHAKQRRGYLAADGGSTRGSIWWAACWGQTDE